MQSVIDREQIVRRLEKLTESKENHFLSLILFYDILNKLFHNYGIDAYPSKEPKHRKVHEKKEIYSEELAIANTCLNLLVDQAVTLEDVSEETNYREYLESKYALLYIIFKALEEILNGTKRPKQNIDVNAILVTSFMPYLVNESE